MSVHPGMKQVLHLWHPATEFNKILSLQHMNAAVHGRENWNFVLCHSANTFFNYLQVIYIHLKVFPWHLMNLHAGEHIVTAEVLHVHNAENGPVQPFRLFWWVLVDIHAAKWSSGKQTESRKTYLLIRCELLSSPVLWFVCDLSLNFMLFIVGCCVCL